MFVILTSVYVTFSIR